MEINQVPVASIVNMGFSLAISTLLPVLLCIYLKRRKKAQLRSFWVGCAAFVVFAVLLEPICHNLVLGLLAPGIADNIFLYALYGAAAASLFEETGRLVAMKHFLKSSKRIDAIQYGVGHGGIEAILVGGMSCINNLFISLSINNGTVMDTLNALDPETRDLMYQQISALWTEKSYVFLMAGAERAIAIALHIALSVLVFRAVKQGEKRCLGLAYLLHFAADFVVVILAKYLPALLVEAILAVAVLCIWMFIAAPEYRKMSE